MKKNTCETSLNLDIKLYYYYIYVRKKKHTTQKKNTITNKNVDANGKVFLCLEQLVVARLDVLYNLGMG